MTDTHTKAEAKTETTPEKNSDQSEPKEAEIRDDQATDEQAEAELDVKDHDSAEEDNGEEVSDREAYANDSWDEVVEKLVAANAQIQDLRNGFIRAKADVENIQRRSQNEMVNARKFAIEGFAQALLSVVDSLDQASKVEIDEAASEAVVKMREGLELTLKQMASVMEKFGVVAVEAAAGVKFDPEIHQAISMVDSDAVESGHIVDVMQQGFTLKDRLLRPAMVVIAN